MTAAELKQRTKEFTLRVMRLIAALPDSPMSKAFANQLIRCASSVGANYRAVCRARSRKDFINKLGIVIEEADESAYWLELIAEGELLKAALVKPLIAEANELVSILTASKITAERTLAAEKKHARSKREDRSS